MKTKKILFSALALLLVITMMPVSAFAAVNFDALVSDNYFNVISNNVYNLAPGATETELVLNNAEGSDRKVVHYFEVDTKNENIEVLPGYYGIDKLDPDNLALDGVEDKTQFWKAEQLTKTVAYYENLGYNVVGAMNTALAYDINAPYGYMVWDGVVLGTPQVHPGSKTYLAIDADGNCELRSMNTPLDGSEVTAISANFDWLVKDGALVSKKVERTSSDASRSMIGIKADGTLVFCQVDGRNAPVSTGLSNYEMGEMMLSLGCVNAVNCDGGGSSTFISKREGETTNTMRSVPSDGSERATINSVIIVSKAKPTGEFDHAVLSSDYNYYAPGTPATMNVQGVDAAGSPAELPAEGITWTLSDSSFGTVSNGVFTSNGTKGDVTVQMLYNGEIVGEKLIHVVDPDVFALLLDETVLPYGKSMTIDFACTYGVDDWAVCVDGAYTLTLSDTAAATLDGNVLVGTSDESILGVDVTATYIPDSTVTDILKVTYGKGSEIIYDFEDGDTAGFVAFDEAKKYSQDNGINNSLAGTDPLAGQFSPQVDGEVFVSEDIVRNGNYALAWSIDNTDADFAGWTYNVIYNIGETIVLRDVENGKNATTLGMWLYIPEGAAGLAFQSQLYTKNADGSYACKQDHFMFTTASGERKNLNSCTEADIPESRWVYASIDISKYDYLCTPVATDVSNTRSPSFIRTYVKMMTPAVHTFYIDDITLDYSSAVDDRVLPTISDVSYTTQDESVALENNATINGNSVSFSAVIADNIKLDYTTGKILVDGNELTNVSASGKYLATTSNVTLTSGVHTVSFEIKDTMGNPMKVTRTFTVVGDPAVVLSGHNDSGKKPEYGSVYYVDVNVADINAVNKLTVDLLLQDANTWEPQGITVAEGFAVTYTLDKVESILSLTIEKNGEDVDETATALVSVPVRLWTWDAIDHITGEAIAPETQYKTGYCPVVTVDCEVLQGLVNDTDPFGGVISVETMINDTVNPWHYHDAELTVLNKETTCTENGYIGRTYCETCQSVVDWGTIGPVTGHNYNVIDHKLVCVCGETVNTTGVYEVNGNKYFLIAGNLVTGWQAGSQGWMYINPETQIISVGTHTISGITYTFDENGILLSGVWVESKNGRKYSYGPDFYFKTWQVIDGETYYFDGAYYAVTGYQAIKENPVDDTEWYFFADDGKLVEKLTLTGFLDLADGRHYMVNGVATHAGLIYLDGYYYYVNTSCKAVTGTYTINSNWTNGWLPAGTYEFDEQGRMIIETKNGFVSESGALYYYVDGEVQKTGLTKIDGAYYYLSTTNGKIAVNVTRQVAYNCIDESAMDRFTKTGTYTFGADGKMVIEDVETPEPEIKNGFVSESGTLYYYVDGEVQKTGLTKIDGAYYYLSTTNGKIAVNVTRQVAYNCIDESAMDRFTKTGTYTFGADGKMIIEEVETPEPEIKNGFVSESGALYYYVNGELQKTGLTKIDGAYYYLSTTNGKIAVNVTRQVAYNCIDESAKDCFTQTGTYTFSADGKMIIEQ